MTLMQNWDANDQALVTASPENVRWLLAQAWDEGAKWAAIELDAIRDERNMWLAPGDNPYRSTQ